MLTLKKLAITKLISVLEILEWNITENAVAIILLHMKLVRAKQNEVKL